MMKKKVAAIVLGIMFCAGLTAGCGQKQTDQANVETTKQDNAETTKQDNDVAGNSEEEKNEETAQENEVTGTIDDIKDFMFVVTDENDIPYSFTFEEKPEGLESVNNGDTVTVKYTGTISEVDPFEGEVLSVEKTK